MKWDSDFMATIKEVAKLAEVSTATVSRVLNENGYVHEETKARVAKAIQQLNYKPNDVARSLFKGRSKMIALFIPDIMNPFFPELARAVEDMTQNHDFTFILCNTDDDPLKETEYIDALQQKSVDGLIIVSSTLTPEQLHHVQIPVVALDRKLNNGVSSVTVNNREGSREAVRYLKSLGCKRIAHIAGPEYVDNAKERRDGYLDEVQHEEWFQLSMVEEGQYHYDEAKQAAMNLFSRHPDLDGLFVGNDLMAVGALKAAESMGIRVPEDLSIIAFDGITLGETTSPSLTTMAQPIYQIGAKAAEMVIKQIEYQQTQTQSEEFSVQLIERESTAGRRRET